MKIYQYYQPNTKDIKDRQGDCTIRALTKFLDVSWVEAFDMLVKYARETQTMINSMDNIKLCLENINIPYVSIYKPKEKKKITVANFAKTNKSGTYILYVRSGYKTHLVCCSEGKYYDTWDCGGCIVYGFFKK